MANDKSMDEGSADNQLSLENKIDLILSNTSATRNELAEYRSANDRRVNGIEAQLATALARLDKLEQSKTEPGNLDVIVSERELMKQQAIKNNICIHGVPLEPKENVMHIAKKLCTALKVKIKESDIVGAYRTKPSTKTSGLIVIKCASFDLKVSIMEAKRKFPKLCVSNITNFDCDKLVYVNHHLTPYYSKLYFKVKNARINGYFVSERLSGHGIIARKHDNTTITIRSSADLERAISNIEPVVAVSDGNTSLSSGEYVSPKRRNEQNKRPRKNTANASTSTSKKIKAQKPPMTKTPTSRN